MIKKIALAVLSVLVAGVLAFCCGYSTQMLVQSFTVALAVILFYGILTSIFIDRWDAIKEQKWYYWTAIGLAVAGLIVAFIATRFSSRLWTWIGYIIVIVAGLINGLCSKGAKEETPATTDELK